MSYDKLLKAAIAAQELRIAQKLAQKRSSQAIRNAEKKEAEFDEIIERLQDDKILKKPLTEQHGLF